MPEKASTQGTISAARWGLAGTSVEFFLQFLVQVCMARLLGPDVYGLAAIFVLLVSLCNMACQGWSWGLIQARELSQDQVRMVFSWQVVFGLSLSCALAAGSGWIAAWFHEIRLIPLLQVMALVVLLNALSATPITLAKRQMDFRYLQIASLTAYVIGYLLIGLPMALLGFGILAPVSAALVHGLCLLAFIWARPASRVRPMFGWRDMSSLAGTGLTAVATNACNWLFNSLDRMVLGRLLSAAAFGNYTVGSNLANVPANVLLGALQPTFLAAAARMQDDLPRMRRAYLGALATNLVALSPLFVLLAVLAPDVIHLLYGPKWEQAHTVLQMMALAMPAWISWGLSTPVLWSTGKKHFETMLQLPLLPLAAGAFVLAAPHGMQMLAMVAAGVAVLRALVLIAVACDRLQIGIKDLVPVLSRSLASMLLTAGVSLSLVQLLHQQEWTPLMVLMGVSAAVLPLLTLLAWRFPSALGSHARHALVSLAPPLRGLMPEAKS